MTENNKTKRYLAVFKMEYNANDWNEATKEFERRLRKLNCVSGYCVQGKLLKEISGDGDVE